MIFCFLDILHSIGDCKEIGSTLPVYLNKLNETGVVVVLVFDLLQAKDHKDYFH